MRIKVVFRGEESSVARLEAQRLFVIFEADTRAKGSVKCADNVAAVFF